MEENLNQNLSGLNQSVQVNNGQSYSQGNYQQNTNQPVQQSVMANSTQTAPSQLNKQSSAVMQDVSAMYYEKKFMIKYLEEKQEFHKVFSKTQYERFVLNHMKSSPDQMLSDYVKQYKLVLEKYFKQVGVQNLYQQIDQVVIGFVKKYNKDFIAYATSDEDKVKE